MRYNTPINFTQSSGGNILDAHHIEFEPSTPGGDCTSPSLVEMWVVDDVTGNNTDETFLADITSCMTDGVKDVVCGTVSSEVLAGGVDSTVCRIEFSNLSLLRAGDMINVHSLSQVIRFIVPTLWAYNSLDGVDAGSTIGVQIGNNPGLNTWHHFILTQAFIDDLFDQGSDTFAVRFSITGTTDYLLDISQAEGCFSYSLTPSAFDAASGTLWYRPEGEQAEGMAYEGSSISSEPIKFASQIQNVDGIVYYENTTLQEMAPGPLTVQWDQALVNDAGSSTSSAYVFLAADDEAMVLAIEGLYRVNYHMQFVNNAGGNSDGTIQSKLILNGSGLNGSLMSAYMPSQANGGEAYTCCYYMMTAHAGDELRLEVDFYQGTSMSTVDVSNSYIEIEFIRRGLRRLGTKSNYEAEL